MVTSININARQCCTREKERLVEELKECDYDSQSPEDRHFCYRWAAKKSGYRSRECLISG
jgi:hypothetical protein